MRKYRDDPYEITSRFPCQCAESGKAISKGDPIIYFAREKEAFLIGYAPVQEAALLKRKAAMSDEDKQYTFY
tara:strand:+ start:395 stop:610 length:216 start_codon:yes stop_codon:yes gene_type:complete